MITKFNNKFFIVDAFTNNPFSGNPASVFFCDKQNFYNDKLLQNIASEFNLSETAFILHKKNNEFFLRWFTPTNEVDLCGHATLASSAVLFSLKIADPRFPITFYTKDFILKSYFIRKEETNKNNKGFFFIKKKSQNKFSINYIKLEFPLGNLNKFNNDDEFIENCFNNIKPIQIYYDKTYYLLIFEKEEDIINLQPNYEFMKKTKREEFICSAIANSNNKDNYDFISRFFAPAIGINEDPVTGSAHTYLARYWSDKLKKNKLKGYQASKRGGFIEIEVNQDKKLVYLIGASYIIATGKYLI
ncbi:MAG: PhzF family phenazine biosynthesis protein [Spirochaetes bacterium]|nr:PhzF family phenazine biosynthesis protein [Spirochaetota bacterium]